MKPLSVADRQTVMRRIIATSHAAGLVLALALVAPVLALRAQEREQLRGAACSGATAFQVIGTYFAESNRRQVRSARACLEPHFRSYYSATVADPDWLNMRRVQVDSISLLGINPAERPCCVPAPALLYLATVTYDASFRRVITLDNGRHRRYMFVGRRASGPWRIYGFLTDVALK